MHLRRTKRNLIANEKGRFNRHKRTKIVPGFDWPIEVGRQRDGDQEKSVKRNRMEISKPPQYVINCNIKDPSGHKVPIHAKL